MIFDTKISLLFRYPYPFIGIELYSLGVILTSHTRGVHGSVVRYLLTIRPI